MVGVVMSDDAMYIGFDEEFDPIAPDKPEHRPEDINRLAYEVLAGKHGRGAAREESLGDMYQAVQEEVLRLRLQGA